MTDAPEVVGVDLDRLSEWMDARGHEHGPLSNVEELGGGTQNILVRFRRGQKTYVLRRGPLHKRPSSDDAMRREARVLRALRHTGVPHPHLIDDCPDPSVIGSAFFLMESVDGTNPRTGLPDNYREDVGARRSIGFAFVDAVAAIGAVDYRAVGLDGLGKPDGFLERQVARWRSAYGSYALSPHYDTTVRGGEVDDIARWLDAHLPRFSKAGLMHGDFHLGNILVGHHHPQLTAVIDWELATIGDPLLDLGWVLATWPDPDGQAAGTIGFEPWDGMPTEPEILERYADHSDHDLSHVHWYAILAAFKLGVILEGTYVRSLDGEAPTEVGAELHAHSLGLFVRARARMDCA